jgi:streptomycin 6-kinase
MTTDFIRSLPKKFVSNTVSLCGDAGREWLDALPDTIDLLERAWSITAGDHFSTLSYNYVAAATAADGSDAVLKIALPLNDPEIFGEAKYLRLLDGRGCPRLLAESSKLQAILIERAVPGQTLRQVFAGREDDALGVLIEVLPEMIRRPPANRTRLIDLDNWFEGLRRYSGTAFSAAHARRALGFYAELTKDRENKFLLHGDLHHENILTASREPYLSIDPKAIVGHLGYEIAVFLNNHLWWTEWKPDAKNSLASAVDMYAEAFCMPAIDLRKWAFCQMVLVTWWSFDEMKEDFAEGLGFAEMWDV